MTNTASTTIYAQNTESGNGIRLVDVDSKVGLSAMAPVEKLSTNSVSSVLPDCSPAGIAAREKFLRDNPWEWKPVREFPVPPNSPGRQLRY